MRRVGAELGTGAASLYRYVDNREDLLDLMTDAVAAEYDLPARTGDWQADLVRVAEQARLIMLRHPWLPGLLLTRSPLGPRGLAVLEYSLAALAGHPADTAAKIEAFAVMTGLTAMFVQAETAGDAAVRERNAAFLHARSRPESTRNWRGCCGCEAGQAARLTGLRGSSAGCSAACSARLAGYHHLSPGRRRCHRSGRVRRVPPCPVPTGKSKICAFSSMRSRRTDLGMTISPCCRHQRSSTWAGVRPAWLAIRATVASVSELPVPSGL